MVTLTNLFKTIKEKGLTKSQVAKDTGISSGNISDWKNGRSMPTAIKLDVLATYLDVSVDYLLGRTDNPQGINQINTGDVGNYSNVNVHNEKKTTNSDSDDTISELVAVFKTLSFGDKAKVMGLIAELSNK